MGSIEIDFVKQITTHIGIGSHESICSSITCTGSAKYRDDIYYVLIMKSVHFRGRTLCISAFQPPKAVQRIINECEP